MVYHYIFGYGSLINENSWRKTLPKVMSKIPARVSKKFRYVREWNYRGKKSTYLGLRKLNKYERGSTINGVLYSIDESNIKLFDRREEKYKRISIPHHMIKIISNNKILKDSIVWTYVPLSKNRKYPTSKYPILPEYFNIVMIGCLEQSNKFANEFLETTFMW